MPDLRARFYREKAEECRELAAVNGTDACLRDHYSRLADLYVGLAEAAEKLAANTPTANAAPGSTG